MLTSNKQPENWSPLRLEKRDGKDQLLNHRENRVKLGYQMVQSVCITRGDPRCRFYLYRQVCLVTFSGSWCCWQGCFSSGSHLAGASCSCSIALGQLWVGVPVTPELLYPGNFSQDKHRNFYFQSSQFLLCLVIYSFSSCFPISSPPKSYKASINQQGLGVFFKHQDGRFLMSWKHRNYCNSCLCSREMKDTSMTSEWNQADIACVYQSHP